MFYSEHLATIKKLMKSQVLYSKLGHSHRAKVCQYFINFCTGFNKWIDEVDIKKRDSKPQVTLEEPNVKLEPLAQFKIQTEAMERTLT